MMMIMEICKAPTLRLKALNKHSVTHVMYIEMEMLSAINMYIKNGEVCLNAPLFFSFFIFIFYFFWGASCLCSTLSLTRVRE